MPKPIGWVKKGKQIFVILYISLYYDKIFELSNQVKLLTL